MLNCPQAELLEKIVPDFREKTLICQQFFKMDFESEVVAAMLSALEFPVEPENRDPNPFLQEMYDGYSGLSVYENCHSFVFFMYESFREAMMMEWIRFPEHCDLSIFSAPDANSSLQEVQESTSGVSHFRLSLILINVIAVIVFFLVITICLLKLRAHKRRQANCNKYAVPMDSVSLKIPPSSLVVPTSNAKNDTDCPPDYDTTRRKSQDQFGNPFLVLPRYSFSSQSFKSQDPIVDAWEEPKKLSEKTREIVNEWVEANEKAKMAKRASMFNVTSQKGNMH